MRKEKGERSENEKEKEKEKETEKENEKETEHEKENEKENKPENGKKNDTRKSKMAKENKKIKMVEGWSLVGRGLDTPPSFIEKSIF